MKTYAVYDKTTGLVRWIANQSTPPNPGDPNLSFIIIVDRTHLQSDVTYSVIDGILVPNAPTLAKQKIAKAGAAKVYHDSQRQFVFMGKLMQIDTVSRLNIALAATTAAHSLTWPKDFTWIAADNSRVPMTAADMVAFNAAVFEHLQCSYKRLRTIKDAILAATTQAELDAIDITAGYP